MAERRLKFAPERPPPPEDVEVELIAVEDLDDEVLDLLVSLLDPAP